MIPLRAYIISIEREGIDTSGDGNIDDYQFNGTIEDLVAESTVSHTTPRGNTHPGSEQVWRLGHASTHFSHVQSCFIIHNGIDTDHIASSQQWLRNQYNGGAENGSEETATNTITNVTTRNAQRIELKQNCPAFTSIDLTFLDDSGLPIEMNKGLVELSFEIPN